MSTTIRCQCEHDAHFPGATYAQTEADSGPFHPYVSVPAGSHTATYVGPVCDECAAGHAAPYLNRTTEGTS